MRPTQSLTGVGEEAGELLGAVRKRPTINVPGLDKIEEDSINL